MSREYKGDTWKCIQLDKNWAYVVYTGTDTVTVMVRVRVTVAIKVDVFYTAPPLGDE
jgi:hypothetical protein